MYIHVCVYVLYVCLFVVIVEPLEELLNSINESVSVTIQV